MLSPGASSGASAVAIRSRKPPLIGLRSITSPTPSTRPVNIPLYQDVGTERRDSTLAELRRRKRAIRQQRDGVLAKDMRRDVQPHVVDEARVPGRGVNGGAPLEQQRTHLPRGQALE